MKYKPTIVFTLPAVMGGVASFNFNIINNANLRKNYITRVILLNALEDRRPTFTEQFDVDEFRVFSYSNLENQFYVLKRLEELIGKAAGAVICDNAKTLQACCLFNNPKTVFYLVHDYFYVNQFMAFQSCIDVSLAHSSFFSDCIFAANPKEFAHQSFYIPYGVRQYTEMPVKGSGQKLKLFFLGRLEEGKGVNMLLDLESRLLQLNIQTEWTIIGKGTLRKSLTKSWQGKRNVQFLSPDTTDDVYEIISKQDIFIFPTGFEGTPVSIMEAMSNGCVTIVNDLPGGIRDMVTDDVGFRLPMNALDQYVQVVAALDQDRVKLATMQQNAWQRARHCYDVDLNANNYFKLFGQYQTLKRQARQKSSISLSRLDKPYFPNSIVKFIRKYT